MTKPASHRESTVRRHLPDIIIGFVEHSGVRRSEPAQNTHRIDMGNRASGSQTAEPPMRLAVIGGRQRVRAAGSGKLREGLTRVTRGVTRSCVRDDAE
jgi:hypothetical protein